MPATSLSRGSSRPITPVEATPTALGLDVQRLGCRGLLGPGRCQAALAVGHVRRCRSWPSPPAGRPARHSGDTTTGAATQRVAGEARGRGGASRSEASRPTSRPSGLMPGRDARARKPSRQRRGRQLLHVVGRARPSASAKKRHSSPSVSGSPSIRFRSCTAWPAAPFQRLSMARHGEHAAAGDRPVHPRAVGAAHVGGVGRLVDDVHERLVRIGVVQQRPHVLLGQVGLGDARSWWPSAPGRPGSGAART